MTTTTRGAVPILVACILCSIGLPLANGQGFFGVVSEPKKDDPQSAIAYNASVLRAAFPALSELEKGGVRTKPQPYKGPLLKSQPLRVLGNDEDEKDASVIILGHDDLGPTKLHLQLERGEDGKAKATSLAGVPGTEWILPPDTFVRASDIKVRGFRLRVLVRDYEWRDPATDKRETIENVIHVEAQNIDDAMPGELVYLSDGSQAARFQLSGKSALFVFAKYPADTPRLIEARGWRKQLGSVATTQRAATTGPKPDAPPTRGVLWIEGSFIRIGNERGKGVMAPQEVFVFDGEKRKCGLLGGQVRVLKEFPLPLVFAGGTGKSALTGSARYANFVLDLRQLGKLRENLLWARQVLVDGTKSCSIHLLGGKVNELFISRDYVVFPEQVREVAKDGPFVRVQFDFKAKENGNKPSDDAVFAVTRNGKEITHVKVSGTQKHLLEASTVKVTDDIVEWRVESARGTITHRGMFGFPMSGAVPGLVEYVVSVPQGEVAEDDKPKSPP